jgi:hypothetical protein
MFLVAMIHRSLMLQAKSLEATVDAPQVNCSALLLRNRQVSSPRNMDADRAQNDNDTLAHPPKEQADPPFRPRFTKEQIAFAAGSARVDKKRFMDTYHFGYPKRPTPSDVLKELENVLIFYRSEDAIPPSYKEAALNGNVEMPLFQDPEEATSRCDIMNVVVVGAEQSKKKRCLVVMDHYQSHHVQMWKRENSTLPLDLVPRNTPHDRPMAAYEGLPPGKLNHEPFFDDLRRYLNNYETSLATLRPILRPIAINNTVTVMVTNQGQAKLLVNFACSARSQGIRLSNVIVFCTDKAAENIAKSLGFATFYDEVMFERIPTQAAAGYGDRTFNAVMWAKIVAAHLVSSLRHDFLFQDVDVVWYKDPMKFFHDKTRREAEFDILLQDDGARSPRFAPYAGNSGFFYARHNDRTWELFTARVMSANQVSRAQSDQSVMAGLLSEHASLFNLRVKTLAEEEFPAGRLVSDRQVKPWLLKLLRGEVEPWVFHVNWTSNTKEKLEKMKQLGMWFVQDTCPMLQPKWTGNETIGENVLYSCCLAEPLIECSSKQFPCAKHVNKTAPITG